MVSSMPGVDGQATTLPATLISSKAFLLKAGTVMRYYFPSFHRFGLIIMSQYHRRYRSYKKRNTKKSKCVLYLCKKLNALPQRTDWWLPRESEGRMDWEFSLSRRKLLQTGWANNTVLLCPTWNYSQHPMITENGKKS